MGWKIAAFSLIHFLRFGTLFKDSCSNGEDERVPVIRHDLQFAEWEAMARIIVKGYPQVGFFPIKLGKAFTKACVLVKKL